MNPPELFWYVVAACLMVNTFNLTRFINLLWRKHNRTEKWIDEAKQLFNLWRRREQQSQSDKEMMEDLLKDS